VLSLLAGLACYFGGGVLALLSLVLPPNTAVPGWAKSLIWYSAIPVAFGSLLIAADLALMLPGKRRRGKRTAPEPSMSAKVTVALTAYNDEQSIGSAVRDFLSSPHVERVIVVSNRSMDGTIERAREAGALVVDEARIGYGRCVFRCFEEALHFEDAELIVLCEGDMTFRAADIPKFLAYLPHADIVNGTRIVEQLREYSTQLSTFMYYGNFAVGKLIEVKHLGKGTFTDAGTTYKLIRRQSLLRLMPHLKPEVNLEFNCHFLDTALGVGEILIECPVTFHPRVGTSKGGNTSNWRALRVGVRMVLGLAVGWRRDVAE